MRAQSDQAVGASPRAPKRAAAQHRALAILALVGALGGSGCDKAACDGVEGGCLALHVEGMGSYDRLEGVLMVSPTGAVIKTGDAATQVTLPVTVQVLPPPLSTAGAGALRVNGYRGAELFASGLVTLSWPEGARIDVKLTLIEMTPAPADLRVQTPADLAM